MTTTYNTPDGKPVQANARAERFCGPDEQPEPSTHTSASDLSHRCEFCELFWCDGLPGDPDHFGMRRDISATGEPDVFAAQAGGGICVPSVSAHFYQNGANDHDPVSVTINVYTPGRGKVRERDTDVYLTLPEAQSLRDHLSTLLETIEAGERPSWWGR